MSETPEVSEAAGPVVSDDTDTDIDTNNDAEGSQPLVFSVPADAAADAEETMPEPPPSIVEAARMAPDHWLRMVDPAWKGEESEPPEWAIIGQYRSGLQGEIEEWQENEEYRPSPRAMGWPGATDPVDEAVQLAAAGYAPGEDVAVALAEAEVAVFVAPGGEPLTAVTPDGDLIVPLFTSPAHLHAAGRLAFETVTVAALLDRIPEGYDLYVNPSAAVCMSVEPEAILRARDAHSHDEFPRRAENDVVVRPRTVNTATDPVAAAEDDTFTSAVGGHG